MAKTSVSQLAKELKNFLSAQSEEDLIVAAAPSAAATVYSAPEQTSVQPVSVSAENTTTSGDTLTIEFRRASAARPGAQMSPAPQSTEESLSMNKSQKQAALQELAQTIQHCSRCPLGATRLNAVPGEGNVNAELMFVGEGPGFDEDRQGRPFVGRAGQLLDKMIAAMGLTREQVYIANIAKCHPMVDPLHPDKHGNDRAPNAEEIACCRKYLEQQIAIICPKYIVALGGVSAKALIADAKSLGALRGKFYELHLDTVKLPRPVHILATFHPAALLRNPGWKKDAWLDLQMVMDKLGLKGARK